MCRPYNFSLTILCWILFCLKAVASEDSRDKCGGGSSGIPVWIWGEEDASNEVTIQRTFDLVEAPNTAFLAMTADDSFSLSVNGQWILSSDNWRKLQRIDLTSHLGEGRNVITVRLENNEGAAGLLGWLHVEFSSDAFFRMVTDGAWKTHPGKNKKARWKAVDTVAFFGSKPWGDPWHDAVSSVEEIESIQTESGLGLSEEFPLVLPVMTDLPSKQARNWIE